MSTKSDGQPGPVQKRTVIEEGAELKGVVSSQHPLLVLGRVEGDVSGPAVEVGAGGVVTGKMKVRELRSIGEVGGEIEAEVAHLSGRIRDKTVLRAKVLDLHTDVSFGDCVIEAGEVPSKDQLIAAALKAAQEAAVAPPATGPVPQEVSTEASGSLSKRLRPRPESAPGAN
jgi:cytoskeletal protein CcmA (bactofilin family)